MKPIIHLILIVVALLIVPAAFAQDGEESSDADGTQTICKKCPTENNVIEITNGVDTRIGNPTAAGDCPVTLKCLNAAGAVVGATHQLFSGDTIGGFSCGAGAVKMVFDCGHGHNCKLEYEPPASDAAKLVLN